MWITFCVFVKFCKILCKKIFQHFQPIVFIFYHAFVRAYNSCSALGRVFFRAQKFFPHKVAVYTFHKVTVGNDSILCAMQIE